MNEAKMDIANFNLTYGKEEPMLKYFLELVYPALKSGIVREVKEVSYSFDRVQVVETELGLALTGILVKDTIIDIFSKRDEKGVIVETNESYPSSPYSFFCIFLKNHRMIYIPNQKGSPGLRSFAPAVRYAIKTYLKDLNKKRKENKESLIPDFYLNIVGLTSKAKVKEELKTVEKIKSLNLRFYQLNGEDYEDVRDVSKEFLQKMRETTGYLDANTSSAKINSPKDKENVAILLGEVEGTAEPTLNVKYFNGQSGRIKNEKVVQTKEFSRSSDHIVEETDKVFEEATKVESLQKTSKTNENIYNRFKNEIYNRFIKN